VINKTDIMNEFALVKQEYEGNLEQMYVDFVKMRFFINSKDLFSDYHEFLNEVKLTNKINNT
jgi:hypothetical protein